jgi:FixJ family two-component response regulator
VEFLKPPLLVLLWSADEELEGLTTNVLHPESYVVEVCDGSSSRNLGDPWRLPRCLIVDVQQVGLRMALALQRHSLGQGAPMILVAGDLDRDTIAKLLQRGDVDVLKQPVRADSLLAAVRRAEPRARRMRDEHVAGERARLLFGRLTPREQEVCLELSRGQVNEQVATKLQISEKTVKFHRAQVLRKLEIDSMAELARLVDQLALAPMASA